MVYEDGELSDCTEEIVDVINEGEDICSSELRYSNETSKRIDVEMQIFDSSIIADREIGQRYPWVLDTANGIGQLCDLPKRNDER